MLYNEKMKKKIIYICFAILMAIGAIYTKAIIINPNAIDIRTEVIDSEKLDNVEYSILYFTDLYFQNIIDNQYLDVLVTKINDCKVDVVLFGGDLISSNNQEDIDYLKNALKSIKANYYKAAIIGEIDDNDITKEILNYADFQILENNYKTLYVGNNHYINIYGFSSSILNKFSNDVSIDNNMFNLALIHEPDNYISIENHNFDYVLAGHSFGYQLYFPFINVFKPIEKAKTYYKGKHENLDISSGTGMKNIKARINSKNEIVLYIIK